MTALACGTGGGDGPPVGEAAPIVAPPAVPDPGGLALGAGGENVERLKQMKADKVGCMDY